MTDITTDPAKEAWIAELTPKILARMADDPAPDSPALQPPDGLSPAQKLAWARANQPPLVELQPTRPTVTVAAVVPPAVLAMSPADKMRWARKQGGR